MKRLTLDKKEIILVSDYFINDEKRMCENETESENGVKYTNL